MTTTLCRAGPDDIAAVATLLHRHRVFYGQPDEAARSRAFVGQRLARGDDGTRRFGLPRAPA